MIGINNILNYKNHSNILIYNNYHDTLNEIKQKLNDKYISKQIYIDVEYTKTNTYYQIESYKNRIIDTHKIYLFN